MYFDKKANACGCRLAFDRVYSKGFSNLSSFQWSSSLFLNAFVVFADTTSLGSAFQSETTRFENALRLVDFVHFFFANLWWWLRYELLDSLKISVGAMFTLPDMILYVMIMSPLLLRCCIDGKSSWRSRWPYGKLLSSGTSFVALLWMRSTDFLSSE